MVILILILLWIGIGIDGIHHAMRHLPEGMRKMEPRRLSRALDFRSARAVDETPQSASDGRVSEKISNPVESARASVADEAPHHVPSAGGGALHGLSKPVYFIRARSILVEEPIAPESVRRLRRAIEQMLGESRTGIIIMDADGLLTSRSPFLVWADPRLDLTEAVVDRYRMISAESPNVSEVRESPHQSSPRP